AEMAGRTPTELYAADGPRVSGLAALKEIPCARLRAEGKHNRQRHCDSNHSCKTSSRSGPLTATQHGANVNTTSPIMNQSTANTRPYPKNARKSSRTMPAVTTYQNGEIRLPM